MNARRLTYREHGILQGLLLLCLIPGLAEQPSWAWGMASVLALIKGWLWLRQRLSVPPMLAGAAGVLAVVLTLLFGMRLGGEAGRDLAVALLGQFALLKLLETRDVRDGVFLLQLGFFLLLTHFLFEQPMWLAAYVIALALALMRTWLLLCHPGAAGRTTPLRTIGKLALIGAPWVIVLFFLFPRLEHPLWQLPQNVSRAISGVSDQMSPGSFSSLVQSTEIAFRAEFDGPPPPQDMLYWRALVLWQYDGTTWRTAPWRRRTPMGIPVGRQTETRYTITLEPHRQRWLYLLDRGQRVVAGGNAIWFDQDGEGFATAPVDSRLRYQGGSIVREEDRSDLNPDTRQISLALPAGNPKTRALGAEWRARYANPRQRVAAALTMFQKQPFAYTLNPPLLGADAVDDFLFRTRRGFCEHYAGSFVYLMRAAGVPARVAVGYLGGELNPVGQYYIVRQADAHAWAEVWLEGEGWRRVDPTAAVAPQRVERGIDEALPGELLAVRDTRAPGWLLSLRWRLDNVINTWNRWVLSYDRQRQNELLRRLGFDDQDGLGIARPLVIAGTALLLAGMIPLYWRRRRGPRDPLQQEYLRFCRQLARLGCERQPNEGPRDFGDRAATALPRRAGAIQSFIDRYVALRYEGLATANGAMELRRLREQLKRR